MTEPPEPRERISIRLDRTWLATVHALAIEETDGNVSLMLRKLLAEALRARQVVPRTLSRRKGAQPL